MDHKDLSVYTRKIYLAVALVFLVFYLTIFYGVHYPFSITFVQIALALLFVISLFWLPYNTSHLIVALIAPVFYFIQLYLLTGIPVLEILLPFYKDTTLTDTHGVDINRAIDSARQGTIYVWVILISFYLCQESEIRRLILTSFAVLGGLILLLALIAPHENTNVLWFYTIPTLIDGWGSPNVSTDLSAGFGFIWSYNIGNLNIYYPMKQVSTTILGPVFNENNYASLMGMLLPLLMIAIYTRIKSKIVCSFIVVLVYLTTLIIIAFYANSRGGTLAFAATSIIFVLLLKVKSRQTLLIYSCLGVSVIFSFFMAVYFKDVTNAFFSGRLTLWDMSLHLFKHSPLTGIGVGNVQSMGIIQEWKQPYMTNWQEWLINYFSHNVYLQWLAEHGMFGFVILLLGIFMFVRSNRRLSSSFSKMHQLTVLLSICFIIFHSALDYSPLKHYTALIFFILTGCFYATLYQPATHNTATSWKLISIPMKTLLLFIAISVAISAVRFSRTEVTIRDLNTAIAPVFRSKHYFDETAKKAFIEQKEEIKLKLLRAETRYKEQRPDNQLVQSIAQAHLLLTEGKDIEELNQAYNWLLIGKKITNNKLYNSMILSQLNLIFNNIDTKQ